MVGEARADAAGPGGIRHWQTRLAGAATENKDGHSRQEVIASCRPMERLALSHENKGNSGDAIRNSRKPEVKGSDQGSGSER